MALSRLSIGKFLELAITIVCLVLHYKTAQESENTRILAWGTFCGFTLVLGCLFAGYLLSTPINKRIDILLSIIGCALFITTGVLVLQEWQSGIIIYKTDTHKLAVTKGWLAIVNGALFLFDVVFTFRD